MLIEGTSILDITKWPEWWKSGAEQLEQTAPGRIITAPIRLPEAAVRSTIKTVETLPKVAGAVPTVLIIAAVGVAGYLILAGRKGTKLIPG